MASDDITDPPDEQRRHLLEEIRRRAEEAELKRIEEAEEERRKQEKSEKVDKTENVIPPPAKPAPPVPFPTPSATPAIQPADSAKDQKIMVLRERVKIALDRGRFEKASDILSELGALVPGDPQLEEFRTRLTTLQEERQRAGEKSAAPESKRKEEPEGGRASRETLKKRVAERFEAANSYYQQEKYEKGLESINEVLALEPDNEEALQFRAQIEKARQLAERIREEDVRRKAEEAATSASRPVVEAPALLRGSDKDFWGTTEVPRVETGYELPPEEKGPVGPPKPALAERVFERISGIRIPIKPVLMAGVVIIVGISIYVLIDNIRSTVSPPQYSLLVLPATVPASDSALALIGEGLTGDLIRDLEGVSELRVIGPVTAFAFRNSTISISQIARNVGSRYYLQWNLIQAAGGIVLQPSLFDTSSSRPVWVSQYQTSLRELPALRLELVRRLASAMQLKLNADEEIAFRRIPTSNAESYHTYLRGRLMLQEPDQYPVDAAIQVLRESTRLDSNFIDAQSGLGWAHVLAYESEGEPNPRHLAEASICVERVVAAEARIAETFRVWGMVEQFHSNYEKAIERLEEAVNISPSDAESQRRLAIAYAARGKLDAALKATQRAVADDPANVDSYTILGLIQQYMVDNNAALRSYEHGLRLAPDRSEYGSGFYVDALVYLQKHDRAIEVLRDRLARVRDSFVDYYKLGRVYQSGGRPKPDWQGAFLKSKSLLEARVSAYPDDAIGYSYLALVQSRLGEFKQAIAASKRAQQLAPNNVDVLYNTARMYALHLDKGKALEFLGKAVKRRFSLGDILDMDFFNLRSEPEFISTITF